MNQTDKKLENLCEDYLTKKNNLMCLNEMARINMNETNLLPSNSYLVYVMGENSPGKFKLFHIEKDDWNARFTLDGRFHSFKKKGDKIKTKKDIAKVERLTMKWVKEKNKKDPTKTNAQFAELLWDVQNE